MEKKGSIINKYYVYNANLVKSGVCGLTHWNGPHCHDLDAGLGVGVEAAVVDRVPYANVPIQRDGAEVHDGRCGEQDVQVDPDGTEVRGQRPPVICRGSEEEKRTCCYIFVFRWCTSFSPSVSVHCSHEQHISGLTIVASVHTVVIYDARVQSQAQQIILIISLFPVFFSFTAALWCLVGATFVFALTVFVLM